MHTIRTATLEDLDDLVKLCEQSFKFSGLDDTFDFDPEITRRQCEAIIRGEEGFMVVLHTPEGVQGVFAGHIFNALFCSGLMTHEGFMFIAEKYRGGSASRRFMEAYNSWGEERGALVQVMVSHEDHDRFTKFYSLFGYVPSEQTYLRKI